MNRKPTAQASHRNTEVRAPVIAQEFPPASAMLLPLAAEGVLVRFPLETTTPES